MIKNILCLMCQKIITDRDSSAVSYISSIDRVTVSKLPAPVLSLSLGTSWMKTTEKKEELKVRISLVPPSKKESILVETGAIIMEKSKHNTNFVLDGFPVHEEGNYLFVIEHLMKDDWKIVGQCNLEVVVKKNK